MIKFLAFFDTDFIKDIIGALIGTGTALLVFYLTIKRETKKVKQKEIENNENRIKRFNYLLESSSKHIKNTILNLEKNIQEIEADNLNFHLIVINPNNSLSRLSELINNEKHFFSYIEVYGSESIKNHSEISNLIDFFSSQIDQLFIIKEKSQNFDYQRKVRYTNLIRETTNHIGWASSQTKIITEPDIQELGTMIKNFNKNTTDQSDLEGFYQYIRKAFKEVLIKYIHIPIISEKLLVFKEASNLFIEIKNQNKHHGAELNQILNNMKENSKLLDEEMKSVANK